MAAVLCALACDVREGVRVQLSSSPATLSDVQQMQLTRQGDGKGGGPAQAHRGSKEGAHAAVRHARLLDANEAWSPRALSYPPSSALVARTRTTLALG